jgi:serine/threonine-protein kinase
MLIELMTTLEAGDTLDHYRLEKTIARSGMSTLYRATDLAIGRQVAIKIPHAEMEKDPILLERFKREQEIGQEDRSRLYMVMEWVDGNLLRNVLNEQDERGERRLPTERAVKIALGILDALDYMHKHGVVHRDLKPENVMVDDEDNIKLIDFGIAMKEDARRLTYAGPSPMLGTPDYISPEQVKGQRGDQRSDIYALGAMLYEMLTGKVPFVGANPLVVMNERVLMDPVPARKLNPEITPQLDEILHRAMVREPRHRYSTAADMAWELEHQEQVGVDEGARRPALRHRLMVDPKKLLLYAGLVLVPVLIFGLMVILARH